MTKDLIDYNNLVDYIYLVTKNVTIEIMIGLDVGVFALKIVTSLILEIVEINTDNIYKEIALI